MARRRYTQLFVTINTNHKPNTAASDVALKQRLRNFIVTDFVTPESLSGFLIFSPNLSIIDVVNLSAVGIENAPKTGFVHAHIVLLIEHHGMITRRKQGGQAALQNLLIKKLYLNGAYATIDISDASVLNYIAKTSGDAEALNTVGIRPEVTF